MHNRLRHLGIAVTFALGALALLGLVVVAIGSPDRGSDRARLPTGLDEEWVVSEREGSLQLISFPEPQISARRVISDPGINSPLVLTQNGREVLLTGHVTCSKGDDYEIQTAVTQSTTGALARGRMQGRCSGRTESFEAPTWVYDEALFVAGPAQACGVLITRTRSKVSDVFQWCRKTDVDLRTTSTSY